MALAEYTHHVVLRCSVAGVPSLAMPVLAGRAAELVDSSSLRFLSPAPFTAKEGGGESGERCRHRLVEELDKQRRKRKKKLPKLRVLPRGSSWSSSTAGSSLLIPAFPRRFCHWLRHSRQETWTTFYEPLPDSFCSVSAYRPKSTRILAFRVSTSGLVTVFSDGWFDSGYMCPRQFLGGFWTFRNSGHFSTSPRIWQLFSVCLGGSFCVSGSRVDAHLRQSPELNFTHVSA